MLWREEEAEITLYNYTLYNVQTHDSCTPVLPYYYCPQSAACAADTSSVWMTEVCLPATPHSECHSTFAEWPGGGAAATAEGHRRSSTLIVLGEIGGSSQL